MERPDWVDLDEVEVGSSSADDEVELAEMGIDLQARACYTTFVSPKLDDS